MFFCENTANQFRIDAADFGAIIAIISGQNNLGARAKPIGQLKVLPMLLPFSWNPFKKAYSVSVPDFTIGMLIESAKAGKWL
jgi:hypothetical protein